MAYPHMFCCTCGTDSASCAVFCINTAVSIALILCTDMYFAVSDYALAKNIALDISISIMHLHVLNKLQNSS